MQSICIIGLGTITENYLPGLKRAENLTLVAVCDRDPNAHSRAVFSEYPFYTDFRQMLETEKPDLAVIATPPATHFEIARQVMELGVGVILEKPAVTRYADLETLAELAKKTGVFFDVMFHWQHAATALAFNRHYDPAGIESIRISITDPYCTDGKTIDSAKVALGGTWIDSGINALSMISTWLPMKQVTLTDSQVVRCEATGLPCYSRVALLCDGVPVEITVDWRHNSRIKQSFLTYRGRTLVLDHTGQQIIDGEQIIDCMQMPRLIQHYFAYFTAFQNQSRLQRALRIHKFLFEVNDIL